MTIEERAIVEIEEAFEQLECRYNGYYYELIEVTKQALKKQIPKKPVWQAYNCCPMCKAHIYPIVINDIYHVVINNNYCPNCGQALDWS